jgi:hypothetical protein
MKIIESYVETPEPVVPVRKITLELPEPRARELADHLASEHVWANTNVEHELKTLHEALGGWGVVMTAATAPPVADELEELEPRPMTDREHLATFGWAWDDPAAAEVEA